MNFDELIDRRDTDSLKYDFAARSGVPEGLLPLWVADMDFRAPDCVLNALTDRCRHGIFGYSESREPYLAAVKKWFLEGFGWDFEPEWLVKTPGVVFAIAMAIRALSKPGDGVLIQQPVYYCFQEAILDNGRRLVVSELVNVNGRYIVDFEDFEAKIVQNNVKLFILCSPHNPVGRVWTAEELRRMGDICYKHGVVVVSDEIHADFVYGGHRHIVFTSLKKEFEEIAIVCTAPTKTFNLAGLQVSNIFIPNRELRHAVRHEIAGAGFGQLGIMGLIACRAAYEGGRPWLEALKVYLTENIDYVRDFLRERLPQIRLVEPEGTYLLWLDLRELGLDDSALKRLIIDRAGLWLDGGTMFGPSGAGYQRINIACPRSILTQAMEQLERAVKGL
jgi:cystathionine beta-lyase